MRRPPFRHGPPAVGSAPADLHLADTRYDLETFWPSRRRHAFDEFCR